VIEPELPDETTLQLNMFATGSPRSRASPSAFASLLVSDDILPSKGEKDKKTSKHREDAKRERRKHIRHPESDIPPSIHQNTGPGFAFDIPSPDDIVMNARRGTSLGQRSNATSRGHSATSPLRSPLSPPVKPSI